MLICGHGVGRFCGVDALMSKVVLNFNITIVRNVEKVSFVQSLVRLVRKAEVASDVKKLDL